MNKSYRSIWNVSKQAFVAASETVSAKGRTASSISRAATVTFLISSLMVLSVRAQTAPPAAQALPSGGQVSAGQASITQTGALMQIQQSSQRAVMNWQSFNVGKDSQVQFIQPNAQSVMLNRVIGENPSQIFGRISANGQVILSNPQGVYFGRDARVDVGGLLATTMSMADADFMAGRLLLEHKGSTAGVVNEGELHSALGGYIALLAPEVRNQGVVIARMGTVAMAAGEAIELQFDSARQLTGLRVMPAQVNTLIDNGHAVLAPDGLIILSAIGASRLQAGLIRSSGELNASSLQAKGGRIVLEGDEITLSAGSRTLSTGAKAGGHVLVGGDWQGNGTIAQARSVNMADGALIDASATLDGDGGKVVLWSKVANPESITRMAGQIEARGAGQGLGGKVETSGAHLDVAPTARVSTVNDLGGAGLWLLDPYDYTIAPSGGQMTGAQLNAALTTSSVSIQTSAATVAGYAGASTGGAGDIMVNDAVTIPSGKTLTLNADGGISGTGSISNGGTLTLTQAGNSTLAASITGTGSINFNGSGRLTLSGANTYTGTTLVLAGALVVANNTALGGSGANSGTTIASGASLGFQGMVTSAEPINIVGTGVGGTTGALYTVPSGQATLTGRITLSGDATIKHEPVTASNWLYINGGVEAANGGSANLTLVNNVGSVAIRGGMFLGTGSFTKNGTGSLGMGAGSSASTFSGGASLNGGLVYIDPGNSTVGTPGSLTSGPFGTGTIRVAGSGLHFQSNSIDNDIEVRGAGHDGWGALRNQMSTPLTLGGNISLIGNTTFYVGSTGPVTVVRGIAGSSSLKLRGSGTLILAGANTYTGETDISSGKLSVTGSLSDIAPVTVASGATYNVDTSDTIGALDGAGTVSTSTAGTKVLTLGGNSNFNLNFPGVIQDGSGKLEIVKIGTGTQTFSGTNTYTGNTTVRAGTLAVNNIAGLGSTTGGTTVESGATLKYTRGATSGSVAYTAEHLTLAGAGVGGLGALLISGNRAALKSAITLTADTVIGTTADATQTWLNCEDAQCTNTLNTNGNGLTFATNGGLSVNMAINGAARVTHDGTGLTSLINQNSTYSGGTLIRSGTLVTEATDGSTVASTGTAGSVTKGIWGTGTVEVLDGATADLNTQAINNDFVITGNGASGAGALRMNSGTHTLGGLITLSGTGANIQVANLINPTSVTITQALAAQNANATLTKSGAGNLILAGNAAHTGVTTISDGTLTLGIGGSTGSVGGEIVNNGILSVNRTGGTSLQALSGTGALTLANNTILEITGTGIHSGSTTLGTGSTLVVNTSSNLTVSGIISGGGALTKQGSSTLTLLSDNTYTGDTTIGSGTLQLGNGGSAGSVASNIVNNAALVINRGNATTMTNAVSGTGTVEQAGAGVLTLSGNLSYSGATTVTGSGTLTAGTAIDLTTLTPAQLAALNSAQWASLTLAQIAQLNSAELAAITSEQISWLSASQLAALTPAQIQSLTATQLNALTGAQLGLLTNAQLEALTADQIGLLTTAQLIGLSGAQLSTMSASLLAGLSPAQWAALTSSQLAGLTASQLSHLSASQLAALAPATVAELSNSQLAVLSPAALSGISATQLAGLSATQVGGLSAAQIGGINPAALSDMTAAQLAALSTTQVAALTTSQIAALPAVHLIVLSSAQWAALGASQLAGLTSLQMGSLSPTQTAYLTAEQVASLNATQLAALSNAALAALTPSLFAGLTPAQLANLSAAQIDALVNTQIVAFTPAQLAALTSAQLSGLSAEDIASLSSSQLASLSPTQLRVLGIESQGAQPASQVVAAVQASLPVPMPSLPLPSISTQPPPLLPTGNLVGSHSAPAPTLAVSATAATSSPSQGSDSPSLATGTTAGTGATGVGPNGNTSGITIDVRGASASASSLPVLIAVGLPKGSATVGTGFSFELPAIVREMISKGAHVEPTTAQGTPLPEWLRYNSQSGRFYAAAVPDQAFPMEVQIRLASQRILIVISERVE